MINVARPIFSSISYFQRNTEVIDESYREHIMGLFEGFKEILMEVRAEDEIIDAVTYALAAFVDEAVMMSNWSHRDKWMAEPLQLSLFGEHMAGEDFFNKLEKFNEQPNKYIELLEIYFLCLEFGFRGRYHNCHQKEFEKIAARTLKNIRGVRGKAENNYFISQSRRATDNNTMRTKLKRVSIFCLTALVAAYGIYWCNSKIYASSAGKQLQKFLITAPWVQQDK